MADAIGSSSIHLSSDIDIDPFCEPCNICGTLTYAEGYCPKCFECYCRNCIETRRFSMTENHKIDMGDDMPKPMADKPVKYQLCVEHDGEPIDRYCFDHDAVICGVCVVRKHTNCKAKHISDACKSFNMTSAEHAFSKEASELLKYANSVRKSLDDIINELGAQGRKTLKEANVHRDKLIKQINESYQDFSTEVTNTIKEQKGKLSGKMSTIDQIIIDLTSSLPTRQQTEAVTHNEQKRFLDLHDNAEKLSLLSDKLQCLDMTSVEMKHRFNMNIQPLVVTNTKLGDLSVQELDFQCGTFPDIRYPYQDTNQTAQVSTRIQCWPNSQPLHIIRTDPIKVKLDDYKNDCNISGLDMTVDGNIILADNVNFKIKLFLPSGHLLSSLKLGDRPKDISVINKSEAAVSMTNKQICVIDMYLTVGI